MDHFQKLHGAVVEGLISKELEVIVTYFFLSYTEAALENNYTAKEIQALLVQFIELVIDQLKNPYLFESFHKMIKKPIDYYHFGLNLIRALVVFDKSQVFGLNNVDGIETHLKNGDNVIVLANHQTEPDPQAISLLLEKSHKKLAEEMVFIAGHRVITDPLAVPFSKGCNLLCIYSKRHIEAEIDLKHDRLTHNQRTMKKMGELLNEGGHCIYMAPSGGRDRMGANGKIEVAHFDPQSIEMFLLITKQIKKKTFFYPLALSTNNLLPPPSSVEKTIGERRHAHCTPIHLSFGEQIDMENFPGSECLDKKERRQLRANYIWNIVNTEYQRFLS